MAEKIQMTALSPTMEEGTIVSWQKKEGDSVVPGDVLCEVETDKATMDYESTQEGTILKIVKAAGSTSEVGQTIAILGESGEDIGDMEKEIEAEASAPAPDDVPPAEAAEAAAAPAADSVAPAAIASRETAPPPAAAAGGHVKASPVARRMATEKGFDISQIPGTGPSGRVVKRDVEGFTPGLVSGGGRSFAAVAPTTDQKIPLTGTRGVIAKRLVASKFSAPHYYLKSSVRMEGAVEARRQLNGEIPEKASFNAFLFKYVAEALKRHPGVNSSWQEDHILRFGSIDIGIAVDLGNGLVTPIVRNCGNKGVVQIDQELKGLIEKTREGKLLPEDYTGATFTISNLGSFGIEEFTAIINPPGAAILAVGEIAKVPVVDENEQLGIGQVMKMTLSCDHRAVDGATGGRFLFDLKRIIENPVRVLY